MEYGYFYEQNGLKNMGSTSNFNAVIVLEICLKCPRLKQANN
jgi:hypothetical protein